MPWGDHLLDILSSHPIKETQFFMIISIFNFVKIEIICSSLDSYIFCTKTGLHCDRKLAVCFRDDFVDWLVVPCCIVSASLQKSHGH